MSSLEGKNAWGEATQEGMYGASLAKISRISEAGYQADAVSDWQAQRIKKNGTVLTFVIPAPSGCDLDCSFCFIRQRSETQNEGVLGAQDYVRFIREVRHELDISAIRIQGYEPLLPASFPITQEILGAARLPGIPTSLVTNGTYLAERVNELRVLEPTKIAVSLDASTADTHDRLRRKMGAWSSTLDGLKIAVSDLNPKTELAVTSVLLPMRRALLDGIPTLLSKIGIKNWTVTVLSMKREAKSIENQKRIFQDLVILKKTAECYGISFNVDDQFGTLDDNKVSTEGIHILRSPRPDRIYTLKLKELSQELTATTPIWLPGAVHARDFLNIVRSRSALVTAT